MFKKRASDISCVSLKYISYKVLFIDSPFPLFSSPWQGDNLRGSLLIRYFDKLPLPAMQCVPTASDPVSHGPGSKFLKRAQMLLHNVQCHLDNQGASWWVKILGYFFAQNFLRLLSLTDKGVFAFKVTFTYRSKVEQNSLYMSRNLGPCLTIAEHTCVYSSTLLFLQSVNKWIPNNTDGSAC